MKIRFYGRPNRLQAMVPFVLPGSPSLAVEIADDRLKQLMDGAASVRVLRVTPLEQAASVLRLELPSAAPPGSYAGRLDIGGNSYEVTLQVAPHVRAVLVPDVLWVTVQDGARVNETLSIANLSNVPVTVPDNAVLGLFDSHGVENAAFKAFTATLDKEESRTDRLVAELASGHGGLVAVKLEGGTGTIAPGESREINLNLHFRGPLVPGHSYFGSLPLFEGTRLPINVAVTKRQEPSK
jgi:hypothetical protein